MALVNPTELLRRNDKWYVGGGGMLIYAPPFPAFEEVSGFWDTVHFGNLPINNLLCVTLLRGGSPLKLKLTRKRWFPDRCEYEYEGPNELKARMIRRCLPPNALACKIELVSTCKKTETIDFVFWTARLARRRGNEPVAREFSFRDGRLRFVEEIQDRAPRMKRVAVEVSLSRKPTSFQITPAHSSALIPNFEFTPFAGTLRTLGKLNDRAVTKNFIGSVIYASLHKKVKLSNGRAGITCLVKVSEANRENVVEKASFNGKLPDSWQGFLELVPHFECSDEFLTRYYWYRWYGIWLNTIPGGITKNYPYPAVAEGIDYFRGAITYSLMCHVRETKWLRNPKLAQGCVLNHLEHQTKEGHFAGHIYLSHVQDKVFYFTDWGGALEELLKHHPDNDFQREIYSPLKRYLNYFLEKRDKEGSFLFDVWDQFETGQEFSSRYYFADRDFDRYGWESRLRMKGVDATYYIWKLARFLSKLALTLGKRKEAEKFNRLAERIAEQVRRKMWDEQKSFFFDYDAKKDRRSPYFSAVGFYPAGCEIATKEMTLNAVKHLLDKKKFSTPFPTPTSPLDDPHFSAEAYWQGERANCPWNGRVWPMVNSHIAEVLAYASQIDSRYRKALADYIHRFVRMMFFQQDPKRPNCFEHYNPLTGEPCTYRGIDDYQHSWVADLILKYAAGVRLNDNGFVVDPFPFGLKWFILKDALISGRRISVFWNRDAQGKRAKGFRITMDEITVFQSDKISKWEMRL